MTDGATLAYLLAELDALCTWPTPKRVSAEPATIAEAMAELAALARWASRSGCVESEKRLGIDYLAAIEAYVQAPTHQANALVQSRRVALKKFLELFEP